MELARKGPDIYLTYHWHFASSPFFNRVICNTVCFKHSQQPQYHLTLSSAAGNYILCAFYRYLFSCHLNILYFGCAFVYSVLLLCRIFFFRLCENVPLVCNNLLCPLWRLMERGKSSKRRWSDVRERSQRTHMQLNSSYRRCLLFYSLQ